MCAPRSIAGLFTHECNATTVISFTWKSRIGIRRSRGVIYGARLRTKGRPFRVGDVCSAGDGWRKTTQAAIDARPYDFPLAGSWMKRREREQGKKGTRERGAFIEEIRFSPFEEFGRIKIRPEKRLWRMKSKHEEMEEDLNASRALCRQF